MGAQGWSGQGLTEPSVGGQGVMPQATPHYNLRPLSLGELLDRTFSVYRSRFALFAGISMISAVVQLLGNALALVVAHQLLLSHGAATANLGKISTQYAVGILAFLVVAPIQAATVWALHAVYLGRAATVGTSLKAVRGRWLRFVGVVLWQTGAALWPMMVCLIPGFGLMARGKGNIGLMMLGGLLLFLGGFGGAVYAVIMYLRNALGVQSAVIEGLTVRQAMRRSKVLTAGAKGKIFMVLLVAGALLYVAAALEIPFAILWLRSPGQEHLLGQVFMLLINFASKTLVTPVALIGLSLVYFDQRIRREGYDLVMMLGNEPVRADGTTHGTQAPLPPNAFDAARPDVLR